MISKARPIHNRMFVKFDDPAKRTLGDLWIPESGQTAKRTGTILNIGPGMEDEKGVFVPTKLKIGDHILIGNYAGTEIKIGEERVHVMRETDVLAMVDVEDTGSIESAPIGRRRTGAHPWYQ